MRELVGELGSHLKLIGRAFGVDLQQRGSAIVIAGGNGRGGEAEHVLRGLERLVARGWPLHAADVEAAVRLVRADPTVDVAAWFADPVLLGAHNRPVAARTANQRRYVEAMRRSDVVFGVGPAGTGKTYLAIAYAAALLQKGDIKRIVLCRPAVEAGEKLGFLPGDLAEKIDPYLRPLHDALQDMVSAERLTRFVERRAIEVAPLAFMRGRTLSDACVVLDEAQNATVEQMKMFLTRLGERARMIVTGDITQIDLPPGRTSGLVHALEVLSGIPHIETVRFDAGDVVRHPLVAEIVQAYDRERTRRGGARGSEP